MPASHIAALASLLTPAEQAQLELALLKRLFVKLPWQRRDAVLAYMREQAALSQ